MALEDHANESSSNQIAKDLPEVIALLTELKDKLEEIVPGIDDLNDRVVSDDICTGNGISFLEVKHHLLMEYLINLVYIMLLKVDGRPLSGAPVVERLTEIRTVIEKIRPIDLKLKYQIDKLMKMTKSDSTAAANPLSFKPNPDNLATKLEDSSDEGSGAEEKAAVYVPPKVSAVPYVDDTWTNRKRKLEERMKQKTLNKSLLKDLREEYSEAPEEIKDDFKGMKALEREKEKERENYEEDHLIRLNVTRKDKISRKEKHSGQFESFGFEDEELDESGKHSKGSKKSKSFRKTKKKFKPKRKKH